MKKFILSTLLMAGMASAADQAMIVFDASGSMWGRVDGKEKITVAKDVLKQVVGQWNPQTQLGLMAYGHRQKGDCNDIEVLVPVSGFDKQALLQQVKDISPKGKTPISRSLQQAADTLRYTEDKATVILISDGKETCDADPCATAKALKEKGIDFVTHVIGFDVDKDTDAQLSCVAKATGGQYFSAKNAQALNQAMQTVVKTVQEAPPPQPKPKPAASKYNLHIKAFETEGGKQVRASHRIYQPIDEDNNKQIESCWSEIDKACKERLPVGKYFLVSKYNQFEVKTPFTVSAGQTTSLNVIMGQTGKVKITAFETEGGKQVRASHRIYQPIDEDNNKQIESCWSEIDKACKERLPVGKYFLVSKYNQFEVKTPFTVTAGQTTNLNVIMGQTGKVKITAFETEGGKQVRASHRIYQPIDEDNNKQIESCWSEIDKACKERLPVGKYFLVSKYNQFEVKTPFTISAGQTTKLVIDFEPIHISAVGMNVCSPVTFSVIDANGRTIAEKKAPASIGVNFVLPDGKYRVEADNDNTAKTVEIDTVTQGKTVRIDFGGNAAAQTIAGQWKTSQGWAKLQLDGSQVEGTYEDDNGRLFGEYDAATNTFTGYWIENDSDKTCDSQQRGSNHWGRIKWHFDENRCIFTGAWGYCGHKPNHDWTGSFLKPLTQSMPNKQALIDADKETSQHIQPANTATDTTNDAESVSASAEQSAGAANNTANNTANKGAAKAVAGALSKMMGGAKPSAEQSDTTTANTSAKNLQPQVKQGSANAGEFTSSGDKTVAQAKAVMGLIQAFGDKEDVQTTKKALQAISGLNDNLSGGVLNIYKQAVTTGLPFMQAAFSCYQGSDSLPQAQACDHLAKQGADAVAKKMENTVGVAPEVKYPSPHDQWNAEIKQKTIAKLQADIKKAELSITCIDNGATVLDLATCVKNNGKVEAKPKANGEDKALQQMGNLLKALGE